MGLVKPRATGTSSGVPRKGNAVFNVLEVTDVGAVIQFPSMEKALVKIDLDASKAKNPYLYRDNATVPKGDKVVEIATLETKELFTLLFKAVKSRVNADVNRGDKMYAPLLGGTVVQEVGEYGELPVYFMNKSPRKASSGIRVDNEKGGIQLQPDVCYEKTVYLTTDYAKDVPNGGRVHTVDASGMLTDEAQLDTLLKDILGRPQYEGNLKLKVDRRDPRLAVPEGEAPNPSLLNVNAGGYTGTDTPAETLNDIKTMVKEAFLDKGLALSDIHFVLEGPSFKIGQKDFEKRAKSLANDLRIRFFQKEEVPENTSIVLDGKAYATTLKTAKAFPAFMSVGMLPDEKGENVRRGSFAHIVVATGKAVDLNEVLNHPAENAYYAKNANAAPEQQAPANTTEAHAPATEAEGKQFAWEDNDSGDVPGM